MPNPNEVRLHPDGLAIGDPDPRFDAPNSTTGGQCFDDDEYRFVAEDPLFDGPFPVDPFCRDV